ncbi:MAG: hypothetical protein R3E79_10315 [Caldilineaceae bacterium]
MATIVNTLSRKVHRLVETLRTFAGQAQWSQPWRRRQGDPTNQITAPEQASQPSANPDTTPIPDQTLRLSLLCLGLAGAGVLVYAPLRFCCPPLLLYLGWRDLQAGYRSLIQERRLNQAVLDSAIVTICVMRGYYIVGSLRFWSQALSQKQINTACSTQGQTLLHTFDYLPLQSSLPQTDHTLSTTHAAPLDTQALGELFLLNAGDLLPCDGIVVAGHALVTQPWPDRTQVSSKSQGATVTAATLVQVGQLCIKSTTGTQQVMNIYLQQLLQQTMTATQQAAAIERQAVADRMALPLLSMGLLTTLLWGPLAGLGVLAAQLGSDAPTLTALGVLHLLEKAAHQAILIHDSRVLEQLQRVNTLVLSSTLAQRPEAQAVLTALRHEYGLTLIVLSDRQCKLPKQVGLRLGVARTYMTQDAAAQATLIQELQREGSVCLLVDHLQEMPMPCAATVTIYQHSDARRPVALAADTTQAILLDGTLQRLPALFTLANEFRDLTHDLTRKTTIPGVLSIAGATLGGAGLLSTVLFNQAGFWLGLYASERVQPLPSMPLYAQRQQPFQQLDARLASNSIAHSFA